jgi:hypothetical protein
MDLHLLNDNKISERVLYEIFVPFHHGRYSATGGNSNASGPFSRAHG